MNQAELDKELIELIHVALEKWKYYEQLSCNGEHCNIVRYKYRQRAEILKRIYLTLLRKAKAKDLRLSKEQLIKRILYK